MRTLRYFVPAVTLLAVLGPVRAEDKKLLVSGEPPLTQDMVDDYSKFAQWRLGPALDKAGGTERLRQMILNDWKNGDRARQKAILADLKWWREDYPKLGKDDRERLAAKPPAPGLDYERARQAAQTAEAIHLLQLQQWNDARQVQIRALSNLQAKHHETMMLIIGNLRPTGRYVYNPATGRHDRYMPD
jgi:hypothetical protein